MLNNFPVGKSRRHLIALAFLQHIIMSACLPLKCKCHQKTVAKCLFLNYNVTNYVRFKAGSPYGATSTPKVIGKDYVKDINYICNLYIIYNLDICECIHIKVVMRLFMVVITSIK